MKFFSTLFLLAITFSAFGQYHVIPNYEPRGNPSGMFVPIDGLDVGAPGYGTLYFGNVQLPQWSSVQQLPFPFYFNGALVDAFKVSTSGVLTFDTSAVAVPLYANPILPDASIPDNSVCILGIKAGYTSSRLSGGYYRCVVDGDSVDQFWVTFYQYSNLTVTASAWWSIVLEKNTNKIFIVDQRDSDPELNLSLGIQINPTLAYTVPGSPNVSGMAGLSIQTFGNAYYEFIPEVPLTNDVELVDPGMQTFIDSGDVPYNFSVRWRNRGVDPVNTLQLNYSVNGGTVVSETLTGLNVSTGEWSNFTFNTPWTPSQIGLHTVDVWASLPNGNNDQVDSNDHLVRVYAVAPTLPPRRVMFEEIKNIQCAWSEFWTGPYDSLLGTNTDKASSIKYEPTGFGTDDGADRIDYYYPPPYTFVRPTAAMNGYLWRGHEEFYGCPAYATQPLIDSLYELPGLFYIEPQLLIDGAQVSVQGIVTSATDFPPGTECVLHIAVIEDTIIIPGGIGPYDEWFFVNAVLNMFPSVSLGAPALNQTFVLDFEETMVNFYDPARLKVVAFVQNVKTKEIYQCGESPVNIACAPAVHKDTINSCYGDSVLVHGIWRTIDGSYDQIFQSTGGCDSISSVFLIFWHSLAPTVIAQYPFGDTAYLYSPAAGGNSGFQWYDCLTNTPIAGANSEYFFATTPGMYAVEVITPNGCPKKSACKNFLCTIETVEQTFQICANDFVQVGNNIYNQTGTYEDVFVAASGCDSVVTTYVSVVENEFPITVVDDTLLVTVGNFTYQWYECGTDLIVPGATSNAFLPANAGTYYAVLTLENGCTAVSACVSTTCETQHTEQTLTLCNGDSFQVGNHWYFEDGDYVDVHTSQGGCDSVVTTHLINGGYPYGTPYVEANVIHSDGIWTQSYQWYDCATNQPVPGATDMNFTPPAPNVYYSVLVTSPTGCLKMSDCLALLCVPETVEISVLLVAGDSVQVGLYWFHEPGIYTAYHLSQYGCDSTVIVHVFDPSISFFEQSILLCQGDSALVGTNWYSETGTYTDVLVAANGADSIVTTVVEVVIVDNAVTLNNSTLAAAAVTGTYQWYDCDAEQAVTGATSQAYAPTAAGNFSVTLSTANGCVASSECVNVQCVPVSVEQSFTVCYGESVAVGSSVYNESGTYEDTYTASSGCESVVTTNLTVLAPQLSVDSFVVCFGDSALVGNDWIYETGVYEQTLASQFGCDSVVTTYLTFLPLSTGTQEFSICNGDSINIGNNWYSESGVVVDILTSSSGCDSIVTTNLLVISPISVEQTFNVCDGQSVTVGTNVYNSNGTFVDVLTSSDGCDSTVTTTLVVASAISLSQTLSICQGDAVVVGNNSYTQSGQYNDTLTAAAGCDSVVTTSLTVIEPVVNNQTFNICNGDSLLVGSSVYTSPGTYLDNFVSSSGCDSTVVTTLNVNTVDNTLELDGLTLTAGTGPGSYLWFDCIAGEFIAGTNYPAYTPEENGSYAVQITSGGCTVMSECLDVIIDGVESVSDFGFELYPNPSGGVFQVVHFTSYRNITLAMTDVTGRVLLSQQLDKDGFTNIKLDALASGSYYVRLSSDSIGSDVRKLILIRD